MEYCFKNSRKSMGGSQVAPPQSAKLSPNYRAQKKCRRPWTKKWFAGHDGLSIYPAIEECRDRSYGTMFSKNFGKAPLGDSCWAWRGHVTDAHAIPSTDNYPLIIVG